MAEYVYRHNRTGAIRRSTSRMGYPWIEVEASEAEGDPSKMTIAQIQSVLDAKGTSYPSDARKADLLALLDEAG